MRPLRRLIISLMLTCAASLPALAIEPDDLPWEDLNNPKPSTDNAVPADPSDPIGDLINQSDRSGAEPTARVPGDVDADRLEALKPLLEPSPKPVQPVETPVPPAPIAPAEAAMQPQPAPGTSPAAAAAPVAVPPSAAAPSAAAATAATGQFQPTQAAPAVSAAPPAAVAPAAATATVAVPKPAVTPAPVAAPTAATVPTAVPAAAPTATTTAPTPQPQPPAQTQTAMPATPAPTTAVPAAPTTPARATATPAAPAPANAGLPAAATAATTTPAAIAPPAATPGTPPPAATTEAAGSATGAPAAPAATVAAAATAEGKLYLPLKRYFETKAAITLKDFDEQDRAALISFYDARMGEALWVTKAGFNPAANGLISELQAANDWGLSADDYKVPGLARIGGGDFSEDDLADAEIKLSLVAMEYARHARGDRIDAPSEQLSSYLDRKPQLIERPKLLEALAAAPDKGLYLRSLHPRHPQFERLRQKLMALRKSGGEDEFEKIPDGPKITPGKSHPHVALVRSRLKVPVPGVKPDGTSADEDFYDQALADAVVRFKEKSQIEPANATITGELRKALNVDTAGDERALLANMEEWRWMPEDLGATHIEVNIPEFMVRVVKNGSIIHEERVVTGRVETQTPIFSDNMRTIVFQPAWNVPESIKMNELLPKLRAGDNPIAGQGLVIQRNGHDVDVWDVDWERADIRNYYIYQPPGDANVLGIVKFLFPNKHSVYLHDTPSKRLFNEKVRTFSHGCMRVRNPVRLAEVIMAEDKGWGTDKITELITTGPENNDVALDHPMPVHVMYFTNWVTDSGDLKSFKDIYGHEQRIKLGLEGRWGEIVKNRDHLLPPEDVPVARGRDDWGDSDDDRPRARPARPQRPTRYTYGEDGPARVQYAPPPPPKYMQQPQKKPYKGGVGDIIKQVLGGF